MCSCKVTSVSTTISNATEEDDQTEHLINVTKWKSDDSITQKDDDDGHHNIVTDVSCVNVPLAFVPGNNQTQFYSFLASRENCINIILKYISMFLKICHPVKYLIST